MPEDYGICDQPPPETSMSHPTQILVELFVVYLASQVGAEIAQRLRMPAVVGEIAAGCAVGPGGLGWIRINEPLEVLAQIGAVLLLFSVGVETRVDRLKKVGRVAGLVGISGVIVPFLLGAAWAHLSGCDWSRSFFIGAALVATSAGITARVLQELGVLDRTESQVILGAAVIDDILAMLLLGVVTALQGGGGVNVPGLLVILAQAVGFVLVIGVLGTRIMRRSATILNAPINPLSPLTLSLAGCFGLAAASSYLGLAAIIGAFLAGLAVAESAEQATLEQQLRPISAFLVPFFFVATGARVELHQLASRPVLEMLAVVTLLAVAGKLIGCGAGALALGRRSALVVGVGMVPRGEVGIIIASLGRAAGVFSPAIYAVMIAMSLLTSMLAPPLLRRMLVPGEVPVPAPE